MKTKKFLCFLALATVMLLAGLAQAQPSFPTSKFTAALNAAQVVPATDSTARGSCTLRLMFIGITGTCEYSGLSSGLTGAYIRNGTVGQNGGPYQNLSPPTGGTSGTFSAGTLSPNRAIFYGKRFYIELYTANHPNGEIRGQIKPVSLDDDVDGDGRTDAFLYRPGEACSFALCSINGNTMEHQFPALTTDSKPFLADFDGDGIADHSFTRSYWKTGMMTTIYVQSRDNTVREVQWGNADLGDQTTFGDYDADGKIDVAVFRPSDGIWYILQSSNDQPRYDYWGKPGDRACPGDYDKDGKTDLCIVRDENGQLVWYISRSSDNQTSAVNWGLSTDTIFPGNPVDVDADGANDILVMRNENGQRVFYALRSSDNTLFVLPWGLSSDGVKLGDYDGDGKTDFAAVREVDSQLVWFVRQSSNGQMRLFYWGLPGDQ